MSSTNMRQPSAEHKPLKQDEKRVEGLRPIGPIFARIVANAAHNLDVPSTARSHILGKD